MTVPRDVLDRNLGLTEWCILHGYRGSIAHGMYEPSTEPNSIDDKDTMAFCVPTLDYYFGLKEYGSRGTVEIKQNEWDVVVYEAIKVIRLLRQGNPNVLSMLWLAPEYYIKISDAGYLLLDNRDLFVGRHAYYPFIGYARGQFQKMESGSFQGYMGDKRKALVAKHGYDTKNAAHLIRILRMGIEFLKDGQIHVLRPDAKELLSIKHGDWTLAQVKSEANRLFQRAEEAFDRSTLPREPNRDKIDDLCVQVVYEHNIAGD